MPAKSERIRILLAFGACYFIWGGTFLSVALAVQSIPPFMMMGVRSTIGGLILLAIGYFKEGVLPPRAAWPGAVLCGALMMAGCQGVLAYAQRVLPSGLSAVLMATVPFWILALSFIIPNSKRSTPLALLGLVPGLAGVALAVWPSEAGARVDLFLVVITLLSAGSWALGSMLSGRQRGTVPARTMAGMQLLSGGLILIAVSPLTGELATFAFAQVTLASVAGFLFLLLAGSVVTFSAYVWLLERVSGEVVATYTFVNPIVAVALGWAVLGEKLGPQTLIGIALVIGSVAAVWWADRQSSQASARVAPAKKTIETEAVG